MTPFRLSLALALLVTIPAPLSAAIIANHTTTSLNAIPATWINTVKSTLRLSYGHTSHGSQPVSGMEVLAESATYGTLYAMNTDGAIAAGILSLADYTPDGDLGNPDATTWATRTRTYLDSSSGTGRNVVIWSWCGQVSSNTTTGIDAYLNTMNQLEQEYPKVTFVYMTGHLDGSGTNGNLNVLNNRIRAYCQAHNKVLFDFADIESYNPDGTPFLHLNARDTCEYDGGNWATEWCASHSGSELCTPVSCVHSEPLNCNLKARAFWWMLARIAGWDGGNDDTTAPVLSKGAPSGQLPLGTTQATLTVTTNENATCRYSTVSGTAFSAMTTPFATTGGTTHLQPLTNLRNQESYDYYIRCRDGQNNSNEEDYYTGFRIGAPPNVTGPINAPVNFLLLK